MKQCKKCKNYKVETEFYKHKKTKDGLRSSCKQCYAAQTKKYRTENKNKIQVAAKKLYIKNKDEITLKHKEYRANNKQKIYEYNKQYKIKNKKRIQERDRLYRESIWEYRQIYGREYRLNNLEKEKARQRKWRQENKGLANAATMKRIASKKRRTPAWLTQFDIDYIKSIYIQAKELEKMDGVKRHVDHIIPLQGKEVSGLHVPWNLQILTAEENMKKNNSFNMEDL